MRYRVAAIICVLLLLTGCKGSEDSLDRAMALRNRVLREDGCSFTATVTADYGEQIYVFKMACKTDREGDLTFTVAEPATIAGITGKISGTGGAITFDDKVLAFQTIADGLVTPVTAPWLFMKTLRSGYLKDAAETEQGIEISIDDSYAEEALQLRIRTVEDLPASAEIFWQSRRILTITVENFSFL
ncbi:MAG: hypothetical protein IJ403_06255 [Oscillospiraceae bacterium]|nr:hypothetical protein [Oscillospiraceae bacterium]